jgi:hypothetical protein
MFGRKATQAIFPTKTMRAPSGKSRVASRRWAYFIELQ